ncbi:hypothetical protein AB4Y33_43205, partial [Paraburkholderia sp. BR14319]|uniref:hypothetical protein n=1 Tax=Paraburkholderia sp. BR14319 TaxID=3237005 RepID=UPI0034D1E469
DIVACLVRIVCLAYLMEAMVRGHGTPKPYRAAEAILEESAARGPIPLDATEFRPVSLIAIPEQPNQRLPWMLRA